MPTYEYRCKSCDYYFEKFQSVNEEPVKTCPRCGGHVQKLFSPGAGLIFKGSGFYITDYKNKNNGDSQESSTKQKPSNGKKEKDSKPAEENKATEAKSEKPNETQKS